ncbi:MAG: hypothetical protein WAO76_17405 [Georgfuchsia sp.]
MAATNRLGQKATPTPSGISFFPIPRSHPQGIDLTSLRIFFVLLLLAVWSSADAQILDRIEINHVGKEAEIRIRFTTEIQYLRHVPVNHGKQLRVFFRLTNPQIVENDLLQETLSSPDTDMVARFTVTYPELINGMLINFSRSMQFNVRPGADARSIVITVPAAPGAKDTLVKSHTQQDAAETGQVEVKSKPPLPPVPPKMDMQPAVTNMERETAHVIAPMPLSPQVATGIINGPPSTSAPSPQPAQPGTAPQTPVLPPPASTATTNTGVVPPPALSAEEIEGLAKKFFAEARMAMDEKDYPKAINRLNRTLGLPPNNQTEAAQALIGQARELNGEIAKAKAEYELFLKAFPSSTEVPRVKERLAALPNQAPRQANIRGRTIPKDAGPSEWMVFGGLSQYWYHGQSHIETTTPPPPGQLTFNTDTLSLTDQDSLISSLDINARRRDAFTDTRMVFRYIDNHNYLSRGKGYSRLNSAYVEQTDRQKGYFVRAGRQNPDGGGVLERFDGLSLGYFVAPDWRVKAVAGKTVEFGVPYEKKFYGTSLERPAQLEQLGYSIYYLTQSLYGEVNRRALGSDMRYFDSQLTLYGLFDYDIDFKDINIALMQANYRTLGGTNYFAVLDHRKTPSLSLLSALPAFAGRNIDDILATENIDQVRKFGKDLTAESNLFSVGFTKPYSDKWQFGADYRLAAISGIGGGGSMPAQPGTGNNHVISGQAIGNSIFRKNDVVVMNGSFITAPTYDGQAYGLNYVNQLMDSLRLDGSLRFYTQKNDTGEKQTRLNPSVRLSYRFKDRLSLECEAGEEVDKTDGPASKTRSDRSYVYFGYRWDFR